MTEQRIWV